MIRLMHAADLHLDSPFFGLSPEKAALRRAEQRQLLERLTEECNRRDCDLLLLAGDLFDGSHIYRDTVEALTAALSGCRAQVFIAPGNHDCLCPGSPYLTGAWPENVHIFTAPRPEAVTLEPLGCRVYGAAFTQERMEPLLTGFSAPLDGLTNLMVLHGDPINPSSPYNPITKAQIAASNLHYLALGHIHKGQLLQAGATTYAWPGCMMGRGFDELGEKGALFGTVSSRSCNMELVPLGARRYEILEVPGGEDPLGALERLLPGQTAEDIYRLVFTGESDGLDIPALYRQLEGRFYGLELRDRTVPKLDLWAGAGEDTLKGGFLRRLKAQYDAATSEEDRGVIAYAARTGLELMEGREVQPL